MSELRLSVHPGHGPYADGLGRNPANYAPLTPGKIQKFQLREQAKQLG